MKATNLFETLNAANSALGLKSVATDKYNYPEELQKLDSKNKIKANFRHKIQKIIIAYLSKEQPTQADFTEFNTFLTTFIKGFTGIQATTKVTDLYSFKVESNQEKCNANFKNYLAFIPKSDTKK